MAVRSEASSSSEPHPALCDPFPWTNTRPFGRHTPPDPVTPTPPKPPEPAQRPHTLFPASKTNSGTLLEGERRRSLGCWKYSDGFLVFARALAGQKAEIGIGPERNVLACLGAKLVMMKRFFIMAGRCPVDGSFRATVMQTTTTYSNDRVDKIQTTQSEGTYETEEAATDASKRALIDEEIRKGSFARYEEREMCQGQWPYGDDCLVHAVASTGENYFVFLKPQLPL